MMFKAKVFNYFLSILNNKNLQAAFVLTLFLVVFYRDVVFYGKTFLIETAAPGTMPNNAGPYNYKGTPPGFVANDPGAIAWANEPINRYISKSVKSGDFPLWNPYAGLAGSPLLADGYTGPLEPIQFLFFFFPIRYWTYAIDLQLLVRFFIAGMGCYLFAQRLKLDFWSSITVGVLFMFSSYFVTFGNHPQIKTEVLLPLVIYGYDRLADLDDKAGFWISSLFVGWAIIAAMPESTFFGLMLGSLWYFYKTILFHFKNGIFFIVIKKILLQYLGSTVLGFLISSIYLLPFLENFLISKHVHSVGSGVISLPLWSLPNLLFQVREALPLQIGFFLIFSFIYLLITLPSLDQNRALIIFWGIYAALMLLAIFDFTPTNWIKHLPVLNQIVLRKYAIPSIIFSLSILVGVFIYSSKQFALSYKKIIVSLVTIFLLFIVLPVFGNPSKSLALYFTNSEQMLASMGYMLVASLGVFLISYLYRHKDVSGRIVQASFLLLAASGPFYSSEVITRPDRVDPYQAPPFTDYLRKDSNPFRFFGLNGILYPNISTAYHISDVRWLNALVPERVYEFSETFIENHEVNTIRLTGTVLPISDQMFNLLNVKYILSANLPIIEDPLSCLPKNKPQPYFGVDNIHKIILNQNMDLQNINIVRPIGINGVIRTTIEAEAPQKIRVQLDIPKGASALKFSIGLNPSIFQSGKGDGVDFQIALIENENKIDLYSKYIDPRNNPCDRKWFDESINLDQWEGKNVTLLFSTDPGPAGDTSGDLAYWGDIQLNSIPDKQDNTKQNLNLPDYLLVYQDQHVQIYENRNVLPRAFMIYDVINVTDFNSAIVHLADVNLNLRETAIIENLPEETQITINNSRKQTFSATTKVEQISSGRFVVQVDTTSPGLLVVTDQYYPGWQAYVDGELSTIYAVDGIFRGVFLNTGSHTVEFIYQPLSFIVGTILSILSLLTIFLFIILDRKNYFVKRNRNDLL